MSLDESRQAGSPSDGNQNSPFGPSGARKNALAWDDYFMGIAVLSAQRSKDPVTQVGAVIVEKSNKRIVGTGYKGFPNGCPDEDLPWTKEDKDKTKVKHSYVVHAEANAILNKNQANLTNCRIYVTLFPCNECAKLIIQSGIKKIVYLSDKHAHKKGTKASKKMLRMANVMFKKFVPEKEDQTITVSLKEVPQN